MDEKGSKKSTPVFTSVFTPVSAVVFTSVFTWVFATRLGSTFRTFPLDAFLRPHGIQGTRGSGLYDFEVAPKSSGSGHPHSACGRKVGCEFLLPSRTGPNVEWEWSLPLRMCVQRRVGVVSPTPKWSQNRVGVVTPTSKRHQNQVGVATRTSHVGPKSSGSGHDSFVVIIYSRTHEFKVFKPNRPH